MEEDTREWIHLGYALRPNRDGDALLSFIADSGHTARRELFATLVNGGHLKTLEQGETLLAMMDRCNVKPDTAVFSRIARHFQGLGNVVDFQNRAIEAGIGLGPMVLSTLVGNLSTLSEAGELIDQVREQGGVLNQNDLNRLLRNTTSPEDAIAVFNAIPRLGRKQDAIAFNTLVSKQATYADARRILQTKRPDRVRIDGYTLNPILRKTTTLDEVEETLNDMKHARIRPDVHSVRALIFADYLSDDAMAAGVKQMVAMGLDLDALDTTEFGDKAELFNLIARLVRDG